MFGSRKASLSLRPLELITDRFQDGTFIVVLFVNCYVAFHSLIFCNNYVSLIYIQLSLGNRFATFLVKKCHLFLPSVYFVAT